jgi:hypothetical protein
MIIIYILAGIAVIASLGWLLLCISVSIASKEEPPEEDI